MPVKSAAYATQLGKSPYVLLRVADLRRQVANPDPDFDGLPTSGDTLFVAGHIRDTTLTFAGQAVIRASDPSHSDNEVIHFLSGRGVANYDNDFIEDSERRVYLSIPFSPGLVGSPIIDDFDDLVGFVEGGVPVGKNLSIAIAVSIASLKNILPSKKQ